MTDVWRNIERKAIELAYSDDSVFGAQVFVECINPKVPEGEEGHVSSFSSKNDGKVIVTFPEKYKGECEVAIKGSEGGYATGTIKV